MRILALMKYGARAASTRQRLLQYVPYLSRNGIEIEVAALLDDEYLARLANDDRTGVTRIAMAYLRRLKSIWRSRTFDAIWVHCEAFPYLPAAFERIVAMTGKPIIYDYDDAIFHQYDNHKNAIIRRLLGKKLTPLLSRASLCICGNAYIQEYSARYCRNTMIIPTVVDTSIYEPAPTTSDHSLTIGWIGSPSTWSYVEPLLPEILPCIATAGARLKVVGAGPRAKGLPGVEAVDWTEESEVNEVQSFDIGIMPLPDEQWARGKCGYKLIQYMACGLPVIASPVGVNAEIVTDGENGYLVQNPDGWRAALIMLLADSKLRQKFGENGRNRVIERYSLQSQELRLLAALTEISKINANPSL